MTETCDILYIKSFVFILLHFYFKIVSLAVPESCLALANCSGITTDVEYWVYPTGTNRSLMRTKIYCHNLATEPSDFISLNKPNIFTRHDRSNWEKWMIECQSTIKPPLKQTEFLKVKIQIEVHCILNLSSFAMVWG